MLGIYNKVGLGLLLAASVAYATAHVPALRDLMFATVTPANGMPTTALTLVGLIVAFAPLFLLLCCGSVLAKPTPQRLRPLLVRGRAGRRVPRRAVLTFTGGSIAMTLAVSAIGFRRPEPESATRRARTSRRSALLVMGLVGLVLTLVAKLLPAQPRPRLRHRDCRRADLRGPHRLRHPATQARLPPARRR
jgi:FtsH-binding integral membrane protein